MVRCFFLLVEWDADVCDVCRTESVCWIRPPDPVLPRLKLLAFA